MMKTAAEQCCVCWQIFPAVLRALKNKATRLGLVEELNSHIKNNRAQLDHQQFDLVVKLINCALQVNFLELLPLCHLGSPEAWESVYLTTTCYS